MKKHRLHLTHYEMKLLDDALSFYYDEDMWKHDLYDHDLHDLRVYIQHAMNHEEEENATHTQIRRGTEGTPDSSREIPSD